MKKLSEEDFNRRLAKIIGLGEKSVRKNYYPELQQRLAELDKKNKMLLEEIEVRKQSELALLKSEALYRTLADNVAEGVSIVSQGRFVYINSAVESIFKKSKAELLGMQPIDLFHPEHRNRFTNLFQQYEKGVTDIKFVALCIRGDGKEIWVQGYNQIIEWQGEKSALATIRDITEEKIKGEIAREKALQLQRENRLLKTETVYRHGLGHLVGTSGKMQLVYKRIIKSAAIDENIVVYGESGTGKELVARTIHDLSRRNKGPFVAVNCGAIPETLFESEFFGHKKGAFSGANLDKPGYFESADNGTLFLDEIGEIPLNLQVKLFRVIEGNGFTPVGSTITKRSNVRIIAATNKNLKQLVMQGAFREDFFYRIHIIPIHLPPLKARKEDIPLLIYHFVQKMSGPEGKKTIPDVIVTKFQEHDWPGNVRELQNAVSRFLAFGSADFPGPGGRIVFTGEKGSMEEGDETFENASLNDLVNAYEKGIIKTALEKTGGNKSRAAVLLGIERRSLQRKIMRLEVNPA